ncbi:hypothetical protein [Staphylococcus canis]|uniref:Uncharacterized protein n=1 Tax=Staphylococcus canis TaxID=2724942 RepID=A0ABS0T7P7_9STAP|nr:hypothetical protein [Staphylococcus canis]MBI5974769.1 hypothetical protein [Staphylococcus canis]
MPHISLLNSWKNHDIQKIDNMIDNNVVAYYFNEVGEAQRLNKSTLLAMLKRRMDNVQSSDTLQWNFEIIHRARKNDENMILFYTYSYENPDYFKTKKTLIMLTFKHSGKNAYHQINSIYITPNIKDLNE